MEVNNSFSLQLTSKAKKQIAKLDKATRIRIEAVLELLCTNPRPTGCKQLVNVKPITYRVRSGMYRVLYYIQDQELIITVVQVVSRKDAYD